MGVNKMHYRTDEWLSFLDETSVCAPGQYLQPRPGRSRYVLFRIENVFVYQACNGDLYQVSQICVRPKQRGESRRWHSKIIPVDPVACADLHRSRAGWWKSTLNPGRNPLSNRSTH